MKEEFYQERDPMQPEITMRDAALSYALQGWPVFPLAGKIPYEFLTPGVKSHGHKDATTDQEKLRAWWSAHPKANIGLRTGRDSGIIVVDMDVPDGYFGLKELQQQYSRLPPTRTSRTANGGLHYFFQHPQDGNTYPSTVGLADRIGVDIRAEDGYVVLSPSKLYGRKSYTWADPNTPIAPLPDWLHAMLPTKREHREYPHDLRFAAPLGEKWLGEAEARATEGNRNSVGFWLACQLRDDGLTREQATRILLLYANRVPQDTSQYTSQEAVKTIKSAYSRSPRPPAKKRP
jgi:Bifunctional DNA primase/polymerase, N-terminal/Primase C terminal 1 (PriCT-1)